MSLIGTLEQFSLTNVLQRIEGHEKSGLLALKQGTQWIEFYLHEGRLLCIGPMRTQSTLGERLLQEGIISPSVLYEVNLALRDTDRSEARFARTLMELGYVSRESLRSWAIAKTADVLRVLLTWTAGEVYFEEGTIPPTDRLLVSMSLSTLIEMATPVTPMPQAAPVVPRQPTPLVHEPLVSTPPAPPVPPTKTPSPDVARVPTLMSASQFLDDSSFSASPFADAFVTPDIMEPVATTPEPSEQQYVSIFGAGDDLAPQLADNGPQPLQAEPVMHPIPPKRIDTSFMQPEMVLWPADLSAFREQNPRVQVTPDQWRILACADGQMPLQTICQALASPPEVVCAIAGELIAEGLVHIAMPNQPLVGELSPVSREVAASGLANGYVAPGSASAAASPWSASLPAVPLSPDMPPPQRGSGLPFETESQWGNGGNGATFIPGRGWITSPQPMQPLQSSGPMTPPFNNGYVTPNGGY